MYTDWYTLEKYVILLKQYMKDVFFVEKLPLSLSELANILCNFISQSNS